MGENTERTFSIYSETGNNEEITVRMYSESNQVLDCYEKYNSRSYEPNYYAEIANDYLGEERTIKTDMPFILENDVEMQFVKWAFKERELKEKENTKLSAEEQNLAYEQRIKDIDNILNYTLNVNDAIDWDIIKDTREYSKPQPKEEYIDKLLKWEVVNKPTLLELPSEPRKTNKKYIPKLSFLDHLIISRGDKKKEEAEELYKQDYEAWEEECNKINQANEEIIEKHNQEKNKITEKYKKEDAEILNKWLVGRSAFIRKQDKYNKSLDNLREKYLAKKEKGIVKYCELVLNESKYPDFISKKFKLEYNESDKTLIIDYQLPAVEKIPTEKECKYIASRNELKVTHLSETAINKMYDKAIYDIVLRSIHEIFEADVLDVINEVVFNGWVKYLDKATGNYTDVYIVSVKVDKKSFLEINLANIESKACFKSLNGVSGAKLYNATAIQPILDMSK